MLDRHCANHVHDLGFAVLIKERQHSGSTDTTAVGSQAAQRIGVKSLVTHQTNDLLIQPVLLTKEPTHTGVSQKASPLISITQDVHDC